MPIDPREPARQTGIDGPRRASPRSPVEPACDRAIGSRIDGAKGGPDAGHGALGLPDATLLSACRWEAYRGPGPGGQKRNKTSSFIRLTHLPTGLSVVAGESRSQSRNREVALRRLRLRIAIERRAPLDRDAFAPPAWFAALAVGGRLAASERNADRPRAIGLALDVLEFHRGEVPAAAARLGVTPSSLVRFLGEEPQAWIAANAIRRTAGLPSLSHRS